MPPLLVLQAAVTWFLTGLIWVIQLVHYPLFEQVGPANFVAYAAAHRRRITRLVLPAMFLEAITAVWLVWRPPAGIPGLVVWVGLGLIVAIWLATGFIQTPLHTRLSQGFDAAAYRALLRSNWGRLAAWSLRGLLLLWVMGRVGG